MHDISRRDMFKQILCKQSFQKLGILLPGGLDYLLWIYNKGSPHSAEEAGLALQRRTRKSIKLADCMSSSNIGNSKIESIENSPSQKEEISK